MLAKVILEVISGPIQGRRFEFSEHDTFLFGRHSNCHARLPKDGHVSRHQFILEANPPDVRIRDLGSLNGTIVNGVKYGGRQPDQTPEDVAGRRFAELDLKDGDRITVGHTTIAVNVHLALVCDGCGMEIFAERQGTARDADGSVHCTACLSSVETALLPTTGPRCKECGRDVAAELGNRQQGQYICNECRSELLVRPGGLRELLGEAARVAGQQAKPSIAGYSISDELGKGGMGAVYRAERSADGATVAVKVMLPQVAVDKNARDRFLREIDVARQLSHPNVVSLLDSGSAGGAFYFVMDFCNGGDLMSLCRQHGGTVPVSVAMPIILGSLEGLAYAHSRKFVHRDLKPPNILLDHLDGKLVPRIGDFGLAKNFEYAGFSGMTATGSLGGTFDFMPREQITDFKTVTPVSDLWSLAATFYWLLTGHPPRETSHGKDPIEVILHTDATPIAQHNAEIPTALASAIDRALATEISERFPTALDMHQALRHAVI